MRNQGRSRKRLREPSIGLSCGPDPGKEEGKEGLVEASWLPPSLKKIWQSFCQRPMSPSNGSPFISLLDTDIEGSSTMHGRCGLSTNAGDMFQKAAAKLLVSSVLHGCHRHFWMSLCCCLLTARTEKNREAKLA